MGTYRIVPFGAAHWKVQRRHLWMFWRDCMKSVVELWVFDTEDDAERWIRGQVVAEQLRWLGAEAARRRRQKIRPRIVAD